MGGSTWAPPDWYSPDSLLQVLEGYAALGYAPGSALLCTCVACLATDGRQLSRSQVQRLRAACQAFGAVPIDVEDMEERLLGLAA